MPRRSKADRKKKSSVAITPAANQPKPESKPVSLDPTQGRALTHKTSLMEFMEMEKNIDPSGESEHI